MSTTVDVRRIPLAAPPWIDTEDERAARRARLYREVAAHDENVRRWHRAIRQAAAELAQGTSPDTERSAAA